MFSLENTRLAIIGLGYVGLPLAVEFSKKYPVIGFDINEVRIQELSNGHDVTLELSDKELADTKELSFTSDEELLRQANVFIVTVPTPIDKHKQPDLTPLIKASEMLGQIIKPNDIIVYESTVYPGATEEDCLPVVEKVSGLKYNKDFFAGYSPERINPGDKEHRVTNILKVTSGSNEEVAEYVDALYSSIITAGTHKAPSIKVAEASKIIENVQRDVNIALINEFFQIFTNLNIDTNDVIEAASTKWNFMKLRPGLVGGHCIGVDPYYLLHKSGEKGYIPGLMRIGREINDSMANYLTNDFLKKLILNKINPVQLEVSLLGFTFKENCPDIRNTKVFDLYNSLISHGFKVSVYDPVASSAEMFDEYNIQNNNLCNHRQSVVILCVGHQEILDFVKSNDFDYIYDYKKVLG